MKKFVFSLEKVMEYKNQNLENKKSEHGKAVMLLKNQEEKIQTLRKEYESINFEFNDKKMAGISVLEASGYTSFLFSLENRIKKEILHLEELKKVEEQKRKEVVEMKIETSSLEKLKEKKYEQYQKEVQKSEELFIEEFVMRQRITN
ncbi:MAG: flagellar export protein FliJ [Candidatus Metalachnospira sp.]|nr:flagellar export protein FliJ [Candidatus Metalachnospira sp.]